MMRISVDLPQPDGPSSVRNSPSLTSSERSRSTRVTRPAESVKSLLTLRTQICAIGALELLHETNVEDAALDVRHRQRIVAGTIDIRHGATDELARGVVADQRG